MTTNRKSNKDIYGVFAGLIAYIISGSIGLYLLRICWTDYAIASKDKSYTFEMLFSRLLVGIIAAIITGFVAGKISHDNGKSAWFAGTIVLCVAAYIHFFRVWTDYPVWYHFTYLLSILPITVLSSYFLSKRR